MKHDATFTPDIAATFPQSICHDVWDGKYRLKVPTEDGSVEIRDLTVEDTWARIADALAEAESENVRPLQREAFLEALSGFKFLPAGRITAGAGTARDVTLFNCFVMGTIPDSMGGIFDMLKEAALTMQQGGGIGYDFSTIRPKGELVKGVGSDASGPLSFMDVWDAMCKTIMSAGARRGAMMATMLCTHPDIEDFIAAKQDPTRLRNFNVSVLVTDAFMEAVKTDADWHLTWNGEVKKTVRARALWDRIMQATYSYAEPGVIFIDRINKMNPLAYIENIRATNPCGEQPLPPYGACLLGSINLAMLVRNPFEEDAHLDLVALRRLVATAVRMMDNVVTVSKFPLEAQRQEAITKRRIGLGYTGLADALIMLKVVYGSDEAVRITEEWSREIQHAAYRASVDLAREKGAFPLFDAEKYLASPTIQALDEDLKADIARYGIRNALLTSIAPTGTISLYAGNVSSGIEPIFAFEYKRKRKMPDGSHVEQIVMSCATKLYRDRFGADAELPAYFVSAQTLKPLAHVRMQAAAQKWIDSSISKTINCPRDISFEEFKDVYMVAYESGCKGCTTYRPNDVTGSVLEVVETKPASTDAPEVPGADAVMGYDRSLEPQGDFGFDPTTPLPRDEVLHGRTYKLKWPNARHAYYITVNDIVEPTGVLRPFEVFIVTQDVEAQAWMVALTRMISAVFRRGGEVRFVAEELKEVFDPRGGAWQGGRYVPSLIAAIGGILERHMRETGFLTKEVRFAPELPAGAAVEPVAEVHGPAAAGASPLAGTQCKACGEFGSIVKEQGCERCRNCGDSKCS